MLYRLHGDKNSCNCYNDPKDPDYVTPKEIEYLKKINRGKINDGVIKEFVKRKKKRRYFKESKELARRYGYKVYD